MGTFSRFTTRILFSRKVFFFLFLCISSFSVYSQNLVPNPSFENYDTCPDRLSQIERAIGWKAILNSPDFFCRCSSGWSSIPYNGFGFQQTFNPSDNCYAGIIPIGGSDLSYHECLGTQISNSLIIGRKYYFSFRFSAGYIDENIRHYTCFENMLGMKMFTFFPNSLGLDTLILDNSAFLYESKVVTDTTEWDLFSGSFIADSEYTFLLIGNFYDSVYISRSCIDTINTLSYIFIDDLCLSESENFCFKIPENNLTCRYTVFPNLGNGFVNIKPTCDDFNKEINIKIINYLGQLVLKKIEKGGLIELDLTSYAKGIYFIYIDQFVYKIILI